MTFVVIVPLVAASCWSNSSDSGSSSWRHRESKAEAPTDGLPVMASRFTEWPFTVNHRSCSSGVWAGQRLAGVVCGYGYGHHDHERL
ncbi:hypothetical protein ACFU93_46140, partial [Streptomyces sp. NPDC057611]|uniref:hypothetical protein n=1 Tax=Streptomyces sp. NPDC057611 TaxID=3346182 RepID=UPI0036D085E6